MSEARVVELGSGDSDWLLGAAGARPEVKFVGVELRGPAVTRARRRAADLPNLELIEGDGVTWLREHVPDRSLSELHVYHPQPYLDPAEARFGMLSPAFFYDARRALQSSGTLIVQTDHPAYGRYLGALMSQCFQVTTLPGPWPDAPTGRTRREQHAMHKGLAVTRLFGPPREYAEARAEPRPWFDPDRPGQRRVRRR